MEFAFSAYHILLEFSNEFLSISQKQRPVSLLEILCKHPVIFHPAVVKSIEIKVIETGIEHYWGFVVDDSLFIELII